MCSYFNHNSTNRMTKSYYFILPILWICTVHTLDPCEKFRTCSDCITDANVCVWCAMESFNGTKCRSNSDTNNWCPKLLQNPKSITSAMELKEFSSDLQDVIQIKPQRLQLRLRTGELTKFNFYFKPADDYPIDLYFLLDASQTMKEVKDVIVNQSENIYETMKNLTNDINLGMGTFVDKNALPYTSVVNSTLTYSFRNHLKLTNNSEEFRETVKNINFGLNVDKPEGGLDGLAQVLACNDQIGWRKQSRKIIIFLTDEEYHAAGDGIVAGIFQPYDGKCYTNTEGIYTKEVEMDYPSASMINKLSINIGASIIFAVPGEKKTIYDQLSRVISGSRSIGFKGNEIISTLKNIYKEITKTMKLKSNVKSSQKNNIEIAFDPDCTGTINNPSCDVKKGEEKQIQGSIKLLEYIKENNIQGEIMIEGINERLKLDIEIITQCDCEGKGTVNSPECKYGGTLECGVCQCNADRYGEKCACTKNKLNTANDNSTCIAEGDSRLCSGRGSCICGTCHCDFVGDESKYEGRYCECNKDDCPRSQIYSNSVCSSHGICECGKCKCNSGWTGAVCECSTSDSKCRKNDKICNNRGDCACGSCECPSIPKGDARDKQDKFCVILPCDDCHKTQCLLLEDCAHCIHQGNHSCTNCAEFTTNVTDKLMFIENTTWKLCPDIRIDVGCYTRFVYRYNGDIVELLVQNEKDCLQSYYLFGGIFLATLILVGIGTLLAWKLLTDARDRREYEKFVKTNRERLSSIRKNPLYNDPTTKIYNPAYNENSD